MDIQDATMEELIQGYWIADSQYHCLFCDEKFQENEVYPYEGKFLNVKGRMEQHLSTIHGSSFQALLRLDKRTTGISEVQAEMLQHFYEGDSDQEIVHKSSVNSVSTVRQHRFRLREKERQARILLALMSLVTDSYSIHKGAKQVDERYGIEEKERKKVLTTYFKEGLEGSIEVIPRKEKKKIIILQHIMRRFDPGKEYAEKEVNEILKGVHEDYVSLRRYLIEYGLMVRNDDGSSYQVNQ